MRKNLSLLLFAIVAGTSMILAENNKIVKIDGLYYNLDEQHQTAEVIGMSGSSIIDVQDNSIAEWDLLPAEFVFEAKLPQNAFYQGLKSVKVYVDNTYINLLVEPDPDVIVDLAWVPFHVFINTDNSDATGGYSDLFTDPNADIVLEGAVFGNGEASSFAEAAIPWAPGVYKWWGEVGGSGWEWVDPNVEHSADDCWGAIVCEGQLEDCTSQFVDGMIEIKINRTKIPAPWKGSEFGIGFDIQQYWSAVGTLPQVSPTDENPRGLAHKLQVKIDNNSYADGETVNNLVIPATITYENITYNVTRIGEKAFFANAYLTSVVIPEGVTSIEPYAFYNCSSITSLTLPNSLAYIKSYAFCGCSSITSVSLPHNIQSIESAAFGNCSNLTSLTIPATITEIGSRVFGGCNITKIDFIGSVEQWCTKSWRPSDLSRSYDLYIQGKKIKDLTLSTNVGNFAFQGCNCLRSVTIADEVTSIGEGAFAQCNNLKSVVIGNGITKLEYGTFHTCTALRDVTLPNSLTEIGSLAFADCQNLESIVIPNNVRTIGESAFINCNLEDIVFGSNLKIIETAAFMYNGTLDDDDPSDFTCSIKSITCYSMRPPTVRENTFYGMPYTTPVYVPADYLTYYQVHDIWGLYDVRPLGATSEETDKVDVETSTTSAEVVWPAVEGAETYELVIKDKQGNVICTLIFNANGQLTSIVFSAPARDNATEQTQYAGFSFTVTGLESGTTYDLTITAKDSNDQILHTTSQTFTTAELTGVEDIATNIAPTKVLRNGQLFILRGDKTYTVQGQEVR